MASFPPTERRKAIARSVIAGAIAGVVLYNELVLREAGPSPLGIFVAVLFLGFIPMFQIDRGDGKPVSPIVFLAHLITGQTVPPPPPPPDPKPRPNGD